MLTCGDVPSRNATRACARGFRWKHALGCAALGRLRPRAQAGGECRGLARRRPGAAGPPIRQRLGGPSLAAVPKRARASPAQQLRCCERKSTSTPRGRPRRVPVHLARGQPSRDLPRTVRDALTSASGSPCADGAAIPVGEGEEMGEVAWADLRCSARPGSDSSSTARGSRPAGSRPTDLLRPEGRHRRLARSPKKAPHARSRIQPRRPRAKPP
jgi:hypothetical protein